MFLFSELFSKVSACGKIASFYKEKSVHHTGRKFFYPQIGKSVPLIPRPPEQKNGGATMKDRTIE